MGRIDDVMNVSGHRISTTEIESALVDHPYVAETAVCGKLDELTGQAVYAFVSLKGGRSGDAQLADELRDHVAASSESSASEVCDVHPRAPQDAQRQDHAASSLRHRRRAIFGDTRRWPTPRSFRTSRNARRPRSTKTSSSADG